MYVTHHYALIRPHDTHLNIGEIFEGFVAQ
jgi:hypothetical protein